MGGIAVRVGAGVDVRRMVCVGVGGGFVDVRVMVGDEGGA